MINHKKIRYHQNRFTILILCILIVAPVLDTDAQNITRPTIKAPNGFEVNSYTGNLFYSRTDLVIPARGFPINVTFSYNSSKLGKNWGMGKGWTFTYNMVYVPDASGIYIERSDGRKDFFAKNGTSYTSPVGVFDQLEEYQVGKFSLRQKSGIKYFFDNSSHRKLTRVEDRNGNAITLSYTDTLLTTLTDASNRTVTFNWQNARLTEIVDNTASPVRKLSYNYDAAGNLVKATDPLNNSITYHYDATGKIIGMTDKRGYNMSIVYYKTSAVAKIVSCVTSQEFLYIQEQLTTKVIELVGSQKEVTSYQYNEQGNIIRKQGNCCGYNLSYLYDANNNISSLKNGINQETKFEYDSRGNLLKETDALGNSITYTYEPVYNQVTSIKDKRGNTFINEYDTKGNLVKTKKPLGVEESYTYAANGDLLSYKDGNGNTTSYEYNGNGYLVKVTNAENGIITYGYDGSGNRTSEKDARNNTTTYQYNALNSLSKITDPLNNETSYAYDAGNNRISETNARGKTTTYTYDGLNRQIRTVTPLGIVTQTQYDEKGNVIKTTDGRGNASANTFNSRNQVLSADNGLGNSESYEYDDAGNKTAMVDRNGNKTKYEYDAVGRLVKVTDALGGTISYSYDANGNRSTMTDANTNSTSFEYDALNRAVKVVDALKKSVTYEYDKNNNRIAETDKNGNKTSYEYDKLNRLKKLTDALGGMETYNYDANDNRLTRTDALNNVTINTYDVNDRLLSVTDAVSDVTSYTYDAVGNITKTVLPNGNSVIYTYDDDSRRTKETDNIGAVVQYNYDNNGNVISETDGLNNTTSYQYDAANRLVKTTFANNTTQQSVYDKNGNKIQDLNQKGYATLYEYDALNRLVKTTDALGFASRFAFDANGNSTNIIDAKGNATSYSYDPLNRLTRQVYPDGSIKRFNYDASGNPSSRTDNNGVLTQYKYDKLNRLIAKSYPNNHADSFRYDAIGRLTGAINENATVILSYDGVNRLVKESLNGKEISYIYNNSNRKKNITYPSGMQLEWELDYRDRLSKVNEGGSLLSSFQYDLVDRLTTKQYRNNTTTAYTYDNVSNFTSIQATPNNVMHINYAYDSLNNRTLTERLHQVDLSEQYTYDKLSQLRSFASGKYQNGSISPTKLYQYNYDALGNRVTTQEDTLNRTYSANNLNQYRTILTNGIAATLSYDANGNTLNDGSNTYTYDFENRLLKVQSGSTVINYKYDALGRRISKSIGGTETTFFFDQNNLIEERENGFTKNYVYGEVIDQILYSRKGSSALFYHTDDLNSVQALTDASGSIAERYTYDDFGYPHIFNNNGVELDSSALNNILFTGRFYEFASQTYEYRNREVNPYNGKFLQRDPLEFIDGFNVYLAVQNNPSNNIDPFGLSWRSSLKSFGVGFGYGVVGTVVVGGLTTIAIVATSPVIAVAAGVTALGLTAYGGYQLGRNIVDIASGIEASTGRELSCEERIDKASELLGNIVGGGVTAKGFTGLLNPKPLSPKLPSKVHEGKQGKHIEGHNNFREGNSILSSDAQTLLNGINSGQYKILRANQNNIVVDFGQNIGTYYNTTRTITGNTNYGTVHYGKNDVHIVPANPNQYQIQPKSINTFQPPLFYGRDEPK